METPSSSPVPTLAVFHPSRLVETGSRPTHELDSVQSEHCLFLLHQSTNVQCTVIIGDQVTMSVGFSGSLP